MGQNFEPGSGYPFITGPSDTSNGDGSAFDGFNPGPPAFNNIDPAALTTPFTPDHLKVILLSDNVTFQVSVNVRPYNNFSLRPIISEHIRFYFTSFTLVNPSSLITQAALKQAFAKAIILDEFAVPSAGGNVSKRYNGQSLGPGIFWATARNPDAYGGLESPPAGPAYLDQEALHRFINSVIPPDVTTAPFPYTITTNIVPYSDLLYVNLSVFYFPPDPPGSFVGVVPWLQNYFSNFAVPGLPTLMEGPFFPYDGQGFDPLVGTEFVWRGLQADYNSAGFGDYLTAHDVKMYLVAVSEGFTYSEPVTSRPNYDFPNGIGF
jgi:hypothetical protein